MKGGYATSGTTVFNNLKVRVVFTNAIDYNVTVEVYTCIYLSMYVNICRYSYVDVL